MGEATERFFEALPARAPAVLREPVDGTVQINLISDDHTDHWFVEMRTGAARVSREQRQADATLYSSASLFDRLVTGEAQGIAAMLRNETTLIGNVLLFLFFRRFFPEPPGTRHPRATAQDRQGPRVRPQSGRPG